MKVGPFPIVAFVEFMKAWVSARKDTDTMHVTIKARIQVRDGQLSIYSADADCDGMTALHFDSHVI